MAATRAEDSTEETNNSSEEFEEILEGKAKILFPKANTVFYNNVQVFNRDLSVAVIKRFLKEFNNEKKMKTKKNSKTEEQNNEQVKKEPVQKEQTDSDTPAGNKDAKTRFSVLEALSATGLRAVRYALEIDGIDEFIANDLSKEAVKSIERNIKHNGVEKLVKSSLADARYVLFDISLVIKYTRRGKMEN